MGGGALHVEAEGEPLSGAVRLALVGGPDEAADEGEEVVGAEAGGDGEFEEEVEDGTVILGCGLGFCKAYVGLWMCGLTFFGSKILAS